MAPVSGEFLDDYGTEVFQLVEPDSRHGLELDLVVVVLVVDFGYAVDDGPDPQPGTLEVIVPVADGDFRFDSDAVDAHYSLGELISNCGAKDFT